MKRRNGFTLIELLIVIAIIAILVAILVPVFFKVKESGRQGTAMENLKLIGQGLAQYRLDNHRAPDVLFGYAPDAGGVTMAAYKPAATAAAYPLSLYPSYVKTVDVFQDPNNTAKPDDATAVTGPLTPGNANQNPANPAHKYFTADAFDISPQVTGSSAVSTTYIPRYTPRWDTLGPIGSDAGRQLQARNPPGDTYVTCTTYHVPNADKVLVLFENGSVKKMTGGDFAAQEANSNFWTVKP